MRNTVLEKEAVLRAHLRYVGGHGRALQRAPLQHAAVRQHRHGDVLARRDGLGAHAGGRRDRPCRLRAAAAKADQRAVSEQAQRVRGAGGDGRHVGEARDGVAGPPLVAPEAHGAVVEQHEVVAGARLDADHAPGNGRLQQQAAQAALADARDVGGHVGQGLGNVAPDGNLLRGACACMARRERRAGVVSPPVARASCD